MSSQQVIKAKSVKISVKRRREKSIELSKCSEENSIPNFYNDLPPALRDPSLQLPMEVLIEIRGEDERRALWEMLWLDVSQDLPGDWVLVRWATQTTPRYSVDQAVTISTVQLDKRRRCFAYEDDVDLHRQVLKDIKSRYAPGHRICDMLMTCPHRDMYGL